jgi:CBS domain-containing protein
MKCSELMKTDVECCPREEEVEAVAERMKNRNVGFLPVCDDDGTVIGTITDRDLALRVLAEHRSCERTRVEDVMSPELVCCSPDDDLATAEELMIRYKKSRIVCADDRRHPLGIISLSDIAHVEEGAKVSQILDAITSREAPAPLPQPIA